MSQVIIRPEDGREIVLGEGRSRYLGRGGAYEFDIALPGKDGVSAGRKLHRRAYFIRAQVNGFEVAIPGRNQLGLIVEDLETGRTDEIASPGGSGNTIGGFYDYPRCLISFHEAFAGYAYPVGVEFVPDSDEEAFVMRSDKASITQGYKIEWDLSDQGHRLIIANCANELKRNHIPPSHEQVARMLRSNPFSRDDSMTGANANKIWQRVTPVIEAWLYHAKYSSYPSGDDFRPFVVRWLVSTGNVTKALLDSVLHGGGEPTEAVPIVKA